MSKFFFSVVLFILSWNNLFSQDYLTIQKSIDAEAKYNYSKAIKLLKKALETDPDNLYLHYKLGKNYYYQNDYEEALYQMELAKPLMKDSMHYQFELYHLYSVTEYSVFAKEAFVKYVSLCPTCVKSDLLPNNLSNKLMYRKPIKEPELMGYESSKAEYYPYIINDNQIQLLNTKQDKSQPTNPLHFQDYLTTSYSNHDFLFYEYRDYKQINRNSGKGYGPFTLTNDLSKIYTTRWDNDRQRMYIYFSSRDTNHGELGWQKFKAITIDIDKNNAHFIHPMLSKDEKHLIFSSDQPGGLGGYDLWIGEIDHNLSIKNVKNLGTYVNTPGDECFPSVYDEDVIFFASNGHYGFGNLDIYAGVKSRSGKIKRTYNLGNRFNSKNDDYALFYNVKKNTAFFTSNRFKNSQDSMPFDRIYKQGFDKVNTTVEVLEENHNIPQGITVTIPSENIKKQTDGKGQIQANLNPLGYKKIVVTGDKYAPIDTVISPFESKISLIVSRVQPKDNISFSLVSTPLENALANTYYKLSNLSDGKVYTGYTNESGLVNLTLYADDEYQLDVPQYNYSKNSIKFDELLISKFYVKNDALAQLNASKTQPEIPVSDHFTLYYETSQWLINEPMEKQIQYAVTSLIKNPTYKLELNSYTDCQGDVASNIQLSKLRLEEAKKLFFSRGVPENQIICKYHGEASPVNDCRCDEVDNYNCSSDEMKKNRRTEVRILK